MKIRKNILILLLSSVLLYGYTIKEEKQTLTTFTLWNASHIGCDKYKVFYQVDGSNLKTKKGSLNELMKLGFDIQEIVVMSNPNH